MLPINLSQKCLQQVRGNYKDTITNLGDALTTERSKNMISISKLKTTISGYSSDLTISKVQSLTSINLDYGDLFLLSPSFPAFPDFLLKPKP